MQIWTIKNPNVCASGLFGGLLQLFGPRRGRNLGRGEFTLAVAVAACHGDHRRVAGLDLELRQEGALFRSGVDEHEFRQLRILRVGDLDPVPYARPGFDQRVNPRAVGFEVERILRFRAVCAHQFQLYVVLLGRRQIADFRKRFALNGRKST